MDSEKKFFNGEDLEETHDQRENLYKIKNGSSVQYSVSGSKVYLNGNGHLNKTDEQEFIGVDKIGAGTSGVTNGETTGQ